ncbi:flagellar motor protein MotD [Motiliproteus sp. SC1-56]|uniref:flagellar motor protein MotD n=1 Tax=Motiliproteus sp. SC1-56 TaxID=2799565 RepID=UPI001A903492|nr:flagellar motor protein MotD [Motiliproteus sp. SC1-56]
MARRRPARQEIHPDRWVVSYADFITLLFAFFVVMYSISAVNEGKYRVLSESLQGVFRGVEYTFDPIPIGDLAQPQVSRDIGLLDQRPAQRSAVYQKLPQAMSDEDLELLQIQADAKKQFQELIDDGQLSVSANRLWVEIEIASGILFPSGNAAPTMAADPLLEALAEILKPYDNPLQVEGFTDNQPIDTERFPSNWELSAARAAGVVRALAHYGVNPERMAAIGFGEYRPKVSNLTPRGRAMNRRVKVIVSRDEQVRRALGAFGSETVSEEAVRTILEIKAEPAPEAPAGAIQQVETEQGVLFTRDPESSQPEP